MINIKNEQFYLKEIFARAFSILRANPSIFVPLGLIYGFGSISYKFMSKLLALEVKVENLPLLILPDILISTFATICVVIALGKLAKNEEIYFPGIFLKAIAKYLLCIAAMFVYYLTIFTGLMLLILPGIYFMTVFSFIVLIIVTEECSLMGAFSRSAFLVSRHFFKVLTFSLLIPLTFLTFVTGISYLQKYNSYLPNTLSLIFTIFMSPFFIIAQMCLLWRIKEISDLPKENIYG